MFPVVYFNGCETYPSLRIGELASALCRLDILRKHPENHHGTFKRSCHCPPQSSDCFVERGIRPKYADKHKRQLHPKMKHEQVPEVPVSQAERGAYKAGTAFFLSDADFRIWEIPEIQIAVAIYTTIVALTAPPPSNEEWP